MWQNMKIPWLYIYIFIYLFDIPASYLSYIFDIRWYSFWNILGIYVYIPCDLLLHTTPGVCPNPEQCKYQGFCIKRQTTGRTLYSIVFLRVLTRTSCFYISYGIKHTVMRVSFTVSRRYQNPSVHGTVNHTIIGVSKSPGHGTANHTIIRACFKVSRRYQSHHVRHHYHHHHHCHLGLPGRSLQVRASLRVLPYF